MTTPTPGALVQLVALPGVRWEVDPTPTEDGWIWLRPRVIAIRAPVAAVEPLRPTGDVDYGFVGAGGRVKA